MFQNRHTKRSYNVNQVNRYVDEAVHLLIKNELTSHVKHLTVLSVSALVNYFRNAGENYFNSVRFH